MDKETCELNRGSGDRLIHIWSFDQPRNEDSE